MIKKIIFLICGIVLITALVVIVLKLNSKIKYASKTWEEISCENCEILYRYCLEKADAKQKEQLEALVDGVNYYPKKMLLLMNAINRTKYITLKEAKKVCNNLNFDRNISDSEWERSVAKILNGIAGAPDREGGSGIHYKEYWITKDGSEFINVSYPCIEYIKINGEDWKTETLFQIK